MLRVGPLVRAVSATSVVIWAELSYSSTILLTAQCLDASIQQHTLHVRSHTVTIGGRHYTAPQLQGLQPATWYTYWLSLVTEHEERLDETFVCCFRTLEENEGHPPTLKQLRIAYGSCRKFVAPPVDALSALGRWLQALDEQKEAVWPLLLLLIGEQIYADQPSQEVKQQYPQLGDGAKTF